MKTYFLIMAVAFLCPLAPGAEWSTLPDMPTARAGACAVVLDGWIYIIGGRDGEKTLKTVERFNPENGAWDASVADLEEKRADAAAVVYKGEIYVIAGEKEDEATDSVERYNAGKNKWQEVDELKVERISPAVVVFDDQIVVLGGVDEDGKYIKQTEAYQPEQSKKWQFAPEMDLTLSRSAAQAVPWHDGILLIGGLYRGPLNTIDGYTASQGWGALANLHAARSGLAAVSMNDTLYAIGGAGFDAPVATIEAWTTSGISFIKEFDMPNPRDGLAAATLDGAIYLFGGADKKTKKLVERFQPGYETAVAAPQDDFFPSDFLLLSNYPNPFTGSTTFRLSGSSLQRNQSISLSIYNVLGRRVARINSQRLGADQDIVWQAVDADKQPLPPGVYLVRLTSGDNIVQQKIMIGR